MEHIFIINPVAGQKNAGRGIIPAIEKAAGFHGISYRVLTSQYPGHAKQIAEEYSSNCVPTRFYAVGGDGTLNEVLAGSYAFAHTETACIPCGSGNDFIHNFGTRADFLDIDSMIRGTARTVDLIDTSFGICASITSVGIDADVAYSIPKYRWLGDMAYNTAIINRMLAPVGRNLSIEIDGEVTDQSCLLCAVCNGKAYGGGFMAAPTAETDDGLLDIILVKKISRFKIASIISRYKKGEHMENGRITADLKGIIEHKRAKKVIITPADNNPVTLNIDGECMDSPRLYAQVIPGAARFVLPNGG